MKSAPLSQSCVLMSLNLAIHTHTHRCTHTDAHTHTHTHTHTHHTERAPQPLPLSLSACVSVPFSLCLFIIPAVLLSYFSSPCAHLQSVTLSMHTWRSDTR